MFVHGLNPIPTNFTDQGTIADAPGDVPLLAHLQGRARDCPTKAAPWDSAMPAWEKFLTEEEIWDVILFLYDFTGQRPRAQEEARVMATH